MSEQQIINVASSKLDFGLVTVIQVGRELNEVKPGTSVELQHDGKSVADAILLVTLVGALSDVPKAHIQYNEDIAGQSIQELRLRLDEQEGENQYGDGREVTVAFLDVVGVSGQPDPEELVGRGLEEHEQNLAALHAIDDGAGTDCEAPAGSPTALAEEAIASSSLRLSSGGERPDFDEGEESDTEVEGDPTDTDEEEELPDTDDDFRQFDETPGGN